MRTRMHTCWLDDTDNHKRRMVDESIIADYGFGIKGKILKESNLTVSLHYVQKEDIDFIYVRYVHNASPFSIRLMKLLKKDRSTYSDGNPDISIRPRI